MTTINEIKDRLDAVAFAGRSYAGADRAAVAKAYGDAVAAAIYQLTRIALKEAA